ncbi:MAG: thymidine kinase [Chitinophagales bacterium]|nr:MAG: thymidine kinase [Chitinophagales bacterium]
MFIEPHIGAQKRGWIEIICGSMFSGKTEELLRRLRRAMIANKTVKIFKPAVDTRYHETNITSHDRNALRAIAVNHSSQIAEQTEGAEVIAIDEAQFFDDALPDVCEQLALHGIRVIVAGLDLDFRGQPFGPMAQLLARAEYITKLHAICMVCGNIASRSFRKVASPERVVLGEMDIYEPRCRVCFEKGIKQNES